MTAGWNYRQCFLSADC